VKELVVVPTAAPPPALLRMKFSALRHLPLLLVAGVFLAWFVLLRPAALGGPASYLWVSGVSMLPTLETGDFVVVQKADHYEAGEILAYRVPEGEPGAGAIVIHRLVGGSANDGFVMQGDNKKQPDDWHPKADDVVGHLWVMVPGAGGAVALLRNPTVLAPLAAGATVFFILLGGPSRKRRPESQSTAPIG
jgi:signal peptidase